MIRPPRALWDDSVQRLPAPVGRFLVALLAGVGRIDLFDRAMTLAAQAFVSLFPLVIAVTAARSNRDGGEMVVSVSRAFALPPTSQDILEQALPESQAAASSYGILGLLLIVVSATSFSRALTRMYARVWGVGYPGLEGWWRWVVALLVVATTAVAIRLISATFDGTAATVGELLITVALGAVLWTWVPWLLLAGAVGVRRLVAGGCLMGIGMAGTSLVSDLYLPPALNNASLHFGAFGVAFTYIGWLFAVATILILATVLGAALVAADTPDESDVPRSAVVR